MLVYLYTIDERINRFAIGYMINPTLHVNKVFRKQVVICLKGTFYKNTTEGIKILWVKVYMCCCTNNVL